MQDLTVSASRPLLPRPMVASVPLLGYLACAWALFLLVDVLNFFGIRDHFEAAYSRPHTWLLLFHEAGPTEIVQWFTLGAAALAAAVVAATMASLPGRRTEATGWLLLAAFFIMLLIEDAGDVRDFIAYYATHQMGATAGKLTQAAYFAALGSIGLIAVLKARRSLVQYRAVAAAMVTGYLAYGVAAVGGVSRYFGAYETIGAFALASILPSDFLLLGEAHAGGPDATGFQLMDTIVEESFELLGASMLLFTALLMYRRCMERDPA